MSEVSWLHKSWLVEAGAWIRTALQALNIHVQGELDPFYTRPWSSVIRVPTNAGLVYFKATSPALKHEVSITAAMNAWRPDCTLPALAMETERSWLLMPDGGTRLREVIRESRDYRHWEGVLRNYAGLQIDMVNRAQDLLVFGAPDRRLEKLPALFASLLEDDTMLRINHENGLTTDEHRRLMALKPRISARCEQLASYGIPETLNHGDLTDGNVFMQDGRPCFFDWGDCAVSHPFYSLRTTFVSLYFSLGLDVDVGGTAFDRLRDVYLEEWAQIASKANLVEAFHLSQALAAVNGALGWHHVLSTVSEADREEYAAPVPSLLKELLALVE